MKLRTCDILSTALLFFAIMFTGAGAIFAASQDTATPHICPTALVAAAEAVIAEYLEHHQIDIPAMLAAADLSFYDFVSIIYHNANDTYLAAHAVAVSGEEYWLYYITNLVAANFFAPQYLDIPLTIDNLEQRLSFAPDTPQAYFIYLTDHHITTDARLNLFYRNHSSYYTIFTIEFGTTRHTFTIAPGGDAVLQLPHHILIENGGMVWAYISSLCDGQLSGEFALRKTYLPLGYEPPTLA